MLLFHSYIHYLGVHQMASSRFSKGLKRSALTVALGFCFIGAVQAQSTTGSIYGTATSGDTIVISNNSGFTRTVTVEGGRFNITSLPVGNYTVTIQRGGQTVSTRAVTVRAGAGADATGGVAADGTTTLEGMTVTGTGTVNPIDITAVDTRSVITKEQLDRLPIGRSAEAVALLAPGAVPGAAGFFGGLVSFGGAGVSENAYYVNGFFTGEPVSNMGGFTLPFGSIEQQETFIGGYSAKYGRSDGGVINQIGRRGTNDWAFGGQVIYTPKSLRGDQVDRIFPNMTFPGQYAYEDSDLPGTLFSRGKESTSWNHSYSVYAGGPIIRDRLFFFGSGEWQQNKSIAAPNALGLPRSNHSTNDATKFYGKLDWSITDNHFLELTYLRDDNKTDGTFYTYDFAAGTTGAALPSPPDPSHNRSEFGIVKYTGYLTDNLTLSALYGRSKASFQTIPAFLPGLPFLAGITSQNPAYTGGVGKTISNAQVGPFLRDAGSTTDGYRVDVEWVLGAHTLTAGIDNIQFESENEGQAQGVDRWTYGRSTATSLVPGIIGTAVTAANPRGYYVRKRIFNTATDMSLEQKAWYLEDRWQVTDNFLLSLGLRNDQFKNMNNIGEAYMDAKNQWAPRLGFAWDVNGDSTFKVFGNAGRYFLAMPNNVAIRGASASTFTDEYFTYTGIAADGTPTGLTHIPRLDGSTTYPYSSNGEYGFPVDVKAFAPSDLKNMYQDEYILGMEHALSNNWMVGAKLTHRALKSAVDDICDPYTFMDASGLTPVNYVDGQFIAQNSAGKNYAVSYCYMFNPGGTNTFSLAETNLNGVRTGARGDFVMTADDWGFPDAMKRNYAGLDIYFERPFDGKWEARIDYTLSKSRGNMEGQVKSEFGQQNISKTQDWDAWQMMTYAYGYLANDRRHQLKARGSYQLTDDLLLSGNMRILSGGPISCLGFFNPDGTIDENSSAADPIHYGASYHTCFGKIATPGSQRTPWTKTVDLGLTYSPTFLQKKLALGVQVRNVFNSRKTTQVDVTSETDPYTVSNTFMLPIGLQTPRTVVFTASYDW